MSLPGIERVVGGSVRTEQRGRRHGFNPSDEGSQGCKPCRSVCVPPPADQPDGHRRLPHVSRALVSVEPPSSFPPWTTCMPRLARLAHRIPRSTCSVSDLREELRFAHRISAENLRGPTAVPFFFFLTDSFALVSTSGEAVHRTSGSLPIKT